MVVTTAGRPGRDRRDGERDRGREDGRERLAAREVERPSRATSGDAGDQRGSGSSASSSWRVSGVSASSSACSSPEMWPTSVAIPVAVTTNVPGAAGDVRVHEDHVRAVAERDVLALDRPRRPSTPGRLSPVSADSATSSVAAWSRRPSAGTTSPASIETTSPGTSCSAGHLRRASPSRRTFALMIIIFWSAATAAAALPSWLQAEDGVEDASAAGARCRCRTARAGRCCRCRRRAARSASGRWYWRTNARQRGSGFASANRFGPCCSSRAAASARGQPRCGIDLERARRPRRSARTSSARRSTSPRPCTWSGSSTRFRRDIIPIGGTLPVLLDAR